MEKQQRVLWAVILVVAGFCGVVQARELLNDTFDIPASVATRSDDASDPADTQWFNLDDDHDEWLDEVNDIGVGRIGSRTMRVQGSAPIALCNFAPAYLDNEGDSVTVTFVMRVDREYLTSGRIQFGLYDSNDTRYVDDPNLLVLANDQGFAVLMEMPISAGISLYQEDPVGDDIASSAGSGGWYFLNSAITAVAIGDTLPHTISMTVTREAVGSSLSLSVDGSEELTAVTPLTLEIVDEFAFRQNVGGDTRVDDVVIETNVADNPVVLVDDTFDLDSGTATRDDDGADDMDIAWYTTNGAHTALLSVSPSGGFGSDVMIMEGSLVQAVASFQLVELENIGEYISLIINCRTDRDYDYVTYPSWGDYSLRLGMYDNGDTPIDADGGNAALADDIGYYGLSQVDAYMALYQEVPVGTTIVAGNSENLTYGTAPSSLMSAAADTIVMTITKTAGGTYMAVSCNAGEVMAAGDNTTEAVTSFNEIALQQAAHGDFYVNEVRVVTSIRKPVNCSQAIALGHGKAADLNSDCNVDLIDFAEFASQWLDCVDPQIASCDKPWDN